MARKKKSRKIGRLDPSITSTPKKSELEEKQPRNRKQTGNKAGTRQEVAKPKKNQSQANSNKDPRLGSKKPIDLGIATKPVNKPKKEHSKGPSVAPITVLDNTPSLEEELIAIEGNMELQLLAGRADSGEELTEQEAEFLQSQLDRYQQLIKELGLEQLEEESPELDEEDDLWSKLDDTDFSDYKD